MEVLNKNQRESAIWRLAGFGVLVLVLNAFVLFASYKAFESKGVGGEEDCRRKLDDCFVKARGDQQRLQNEIKAKEVEIKKLKDELKAKDPNKELLENRNSFLEKDNASLLKKLEMCERSKAGT